MTENGDPVKGLAVASSASAQGIGTVLLIDASNSMKGSINGAIQAARAFVARNPGQPLSIVFFSASPKVALPLTTDREQIDAVLAKAPKLSEGTHIYDALAAAVAQVRGSALGAARIVLLSDGDDVGSVTSLDSALSQLEAQRVRVFTVGIDSSDFNSTDLERIAEETDGSYAAATSPPRSGRSTTSWASSSATSICFATAHRRAPTRPSTSRSPSPAKLPSPSRTRARRQVRRPRTSRRSGTS